MRAINAGREERKVEEARDPVTNRFFNFHNTNENR